MKFSLVVAVVSATIVACSSSSSSTPSGPATTSDACASAYDAQAAYYARCNAAEGVTLGDRAEFVASCNRKLTEPGVASSTASAVQACAASIQKATDTCGRAEEDACILPAGTLATGIPCGIAAQCASRNCKGAGISSSGGNVAFGCGTCGPTLADGDVCALGDICQPKSTCVLTPGSPSGTCKPIVENDVGGSCKPPLTCKPSLRCDATTHACAALSDAGGACYVSQDCNYPLVCDGSKCAQGKSSGQACSAAAPCDRLTVCNASQQCVPPVTAQPGEACDALVTFCVEGACVAGKCPALIAEGQPCTTPMTDTTCAADAYCVSGKCQTFDPSTCK